MSKVRDLKKVVAKIEKIQTKIERRIDNLKRNYVSNRTILDKLKQQQELSKEVA